MGNRKSFRISEIADEIKANYNTGYIKGWDNGFYTGDKLFSYKPGYHTMVYAHPHSGKTQFVMEQAIYLSKKYGIKHLVYFPENGRKHEVVGDLIMIYIGQRPFGPGHLDVTDDKLDEAISWLDKYFMLLAPEDGVLTLKDAFNEVHVLRKDFNVNMVWLDNFGYISRDETHKGLSIAEYVKDSLQFMLKASLGMNVHTVLLAHLRDMEPITDKETGIWYMPKPHASEIAGGQQNWNFGFQLIGLWRAPEGVIDKETGVPYGHNELHVLVQKSKPKGIGRLGTLKLWFDEDRQRFMENESERMFSIGEYEAWNNNTNVKQGSLNMNNITRDPDNYPF